MHNAYLPIDELLVLRFSIRGLSGTNGIVGRPLRVVHIAAPIDKLLVLGFSIGGLSGTNGIIGGPFGMLSIRNRSCDTCEEWLWTEGFWCHNTYKQWP